MSIVNTELVAYGASSRPTDDASASGGAIDATRRPGFTQLSSNSVVTVASDGTDARTVTVSGRDATGALVQDTIVCNDTNDVAGVITFERIHSVDVSASDGSRTISIKQGATTLATIPPNEIGFYALFTGSASSASQTVRYEKIFWKNTNGSLTLTASQITLTADPASKIKVGVATAINDSVSVANRSTAPGGVTFVDDGVAQNIPNSQNLPAGAAIGVWIQQTLAANDSPVKSTFTTQLNGTSV